MSAASATRTAWREREAGPPHDADGQRVAEEEGERDRQGHGRGVRAARRGPDDHPQDLADGAPGQAVQRRLPGIRPGHRMRCAVMLLLCVPMERDAWGPPSSGTPRGMYLTVVLLGRRPQAAAPRRGRRSGSAGTQPPSPQGGSRLRFDGQFCRSPARAPRRDVDRLRAVRRTADPGRPRRTRRRGAGDDRAVSPARPGRPPGRRPVGCSATSASVAGEDAVDRVLERGRRPVHRRAARGPVALVELRDPDPPVRGRDRGRSTTRS